MKKVLIGDTLYNQVYLIHFNDTKGATINITKLAFDDEEFRRAFSDKNDKKVFIGDDMVALTCIGSAYTTVVNEEVIELAKENAIEWYNKQIGFATEALVTHTLNIKKVKKVNFKKLQFKD